MPDNKGLHILNFLALKIYSHIISKVINFDRWQATHAFGGNLLLVRSKAFDRWIGGKFLIPKFVAWTSVERMNE